MVQKAAKKGDSRVDRSGGFVSPINFMGTLAGAYRVVKGNCSRAVAETTS